MARLTDETELYDIAPDGKTILRTGVVVIKDVQFSELVNQIRLMNSTIRMMLEEQRKVNIYLEDITDLGIILDDVK